MTTAKGKARKGGFTLTPIILSEPIKSTDGFTNLIEETASDEKKVESNENPEGKAAGFNKVKKDKAPEPVEKEEISTIQSKTAVSDKSNKKLPEMTGKGKENPRVTEHELLKLLDAESIEEIYELSDVLRASSLKLYATLIRLADSKGRARIKNHELMSKAGIKGIATLYKQERWLMDLKLLEKKAKPGPHDGSSYVVHRLESLPLPAEIFEKFDEYLAGF
ncbi:hypothetical protein H6S82_00535 [Planktothrix sp. FACHB-1355]|uniref:hypothetical protein n=1 Tax=Planktothrix sp. FACHB-1355 TaxID=2692854 RepID=UPI00168AA773|nr:hypothetical protein [Planktothrix sp. FACHB-1355]MBD3557356.1 hypothetical protein [Planktothrix sp. FACHB-1355]